MKHYRKETKTREEKNHYSFAHLKWGFYVNGFPPEINWHIIWLGQTMLGQTNWIESWHLASLLTARTMQTPSNSTPPPPSPFHPHSFHWLTNSYLAIPTHPLNHLCAEVVSLTHIHVYTLLLWLVKWPFRQTRPLPTWSNGLWTKHSRTSSFSPKNSVWWPYHAFSHVCSYEHKFLIKLLNNINSLAGEVTTPVFSIGET